MGPFRTGICCSNVASSESSSHFLDVSRIPVTKTAFCGTTHACEADHIWLTISNSHTAPGGYFEFHDYDAVLKSATGTPLTPENSDLAQWWSFVIDTASKSGRSFQIATSMKERVEKAG